MKTISLAGQWQVKGEDAVTGEKLTLLGQVPGSALNDIVLQQAEPCDIFWRDHAERFQKYERYNWQYSKEFDLEDVGLPSEIVFERLDTYCDVYLNGTHLGYCDNGFIRHTFPTDGILKSGKNLLEVYFYSPVEQVKNKRSFPGAFTTERLHTRRTQCTYGWDWTMRFVSCGIGGEVFVKLYEPEEPTVDNVYIYTKSVDAMGAYIGIKVAFGRCFADKVYDFDVFDKDGKKVKSHSRRCSYKTYAFNLSIEQAQLWYPAGYGEQPLYTLVISHEGKPVFRETFGIRTVKICQIPDEIGSESYEKCLKLKQSSFSREYDHNNAFSSFILVVNGVKILCRGANWVPCEPFETGNTDEKITDLLELAKEMGLNMLRVWGGGAFESRHFYEECSRLGIMVTQDFLMACGTYPEKEEWFLRQLQKEADYAAKLIRNQPCLMWWSGDNENAVMGDDCMADYTGRSSASLGIHPVLMELDPERDFLPSSPYGGSFYASNTVGTTHNTQYLSHIFQTIESAPLDDYKDRIKKMCARFIAEEPTFGAASSYSNRKFMTREDLFGENDDIRRYHTKSNPALQKELFDYLLILTEKVLGAFKDGSDRLFKLKYMQYESVRLSLEQLRRERWFCSGVIFWMLEDCWPSFAGWAFIDYYRMPKASFYSFKRCSKPVICSLDKDGGVYSLYVCNDGITDVSGRATVYALNEKGERKDLFCGQFQVKTGENSRVTSFRYEENDLLLAEMDGAWGHDRAFYRNGALPVFKTDVETVIDEEQGTVTVKAGTHYVHAVEIEGNLVLEDNYFSLIPGETKTVPFRRKNSKLPLDITVEAYTLDGMCPDKT